MMIKCYYDRYYFVGYLKKGKYVYWKCYCRKDRKIYKSKQVSQLQLDKQFYELFANLTVSIEVEQELRKALLKMHNEKNMFSERTIGQINSQIEKAEKQRKILLSKLLEGVIDDITYKEIKMELDIKIDKLELERQKIKEAPKDFTYYVENLLELCKDAPRLWNSAECTKKESLVKNRLLELATQRR